MNYKEEVEVYFENYAHKVKMLEHKAKVTDEKRFELLNIVKDKGEEYFYFEYIEQKGNMVYFSGNST